MRAIRHPTHEARAVAAGFGKHLGQLAGGLIALDGGLVEPVVPAGSLTLLGDHQGKDRNDVLAEGGEVARFGSVLKTGQQSGV